VGATGAGRACPLAVVPFLGNRSSGRMGVALAAEARRRGADVTLVASNLTVEPPLAIALAAAPPAADVERATAGSDADVVLMAAAVADYRPSETDEAKRPKDDTRTTIQLATTADVL